MSFKRQVTITFVTRIVAFVLTLITNIIIARLLGPQGKGVYALVLLVLNLLFIFTNMGLAAPIIYYVSKRQFPLGDIVSSLISFVGIIGPILILTIIFIIKNYSLELLKGVNPQYIIIIILALPFKLLSSYLNSIFLALKKIKVYNFYSVFPSLLFVIFFMISLLIPKNIVFLAILSRLLAIIIASLTIMFFIGKLVKIKLRINTKFLKSSINFGLKSYLDSITNFFNYRLDMFLVNYFLSTTAVGYYSLAVGLAEFIWFVPGAAKTVLFPKVASTDLQQAKEFTPKVCRHVLMITLIMSGGYILFGKLLIKLVYGEIFLPALKPLLALLPGVLMLSIHKIITSDLLGRGKPVIQAIISSIVFIMTIVFDFILIPKYGVIGAAFASTIAYSAASIIGLFIYLKISGNSIWDMIIFKSQDLQTYKVGLEKILSFRLTVK